MSTGTKESVGDQCSNYEQGKKDMKNTPRHHKITGIE